MTEGSNSPSKRRLWRRAVGLFVVIGTILAACSSGSEDGDDPPADASSETTAEASESNGEIQEEPADDTTPTGDDASDESTVVVGAPFDHAGLDGNSNSDRPWTQMRANWFDSLLVRGPDGSLGPRVLTEWEYDQSTFTWTFTMRDDVVFSTGEAATSADLAATLDRISHPEEHPSTYEEWWNISEVRIIDDYTIEVEMNEDNPLVLTRAPSYGILPASWIEEVGGDYYEGTEPPPSSGPYVMTEWRQDDQVISEAFEDFRDPPEIGNYIIRIVPDAAARVAGLQSGDLDLIFPVPPQLAESIENDPELEVVPIEGTTRVRLLMDTRQPPFDDIRVREAVNLAIDRQEIIDALLPGAVQTPMMIIPEETGFNPELEPYPYDPDRARDLLEEAGYGDGIGPIEMTVSQERLFSGDEHIVVAEQLAAVGIEVDIRVLPPDDFDNQLLEEEENPGSIGELILHGHGGGNTWHAAFTMGDVQPCGPDGVAEHEEHWHYCNTEVADLVSESVATWPTDEEESIAMMQEADRVMWEDYAIAPLWQPAELYAKRADLSYEVFYDLYMADARWED